LKLRSTGLNPARHETSAWEGFVNSMSLPISMSGFHRRGYERQHEAEATAQIVAFIGGVNAGCVHQSKRAGSEASDEKRIFCSACAAEPSLFISLLDMRSGK
jgi:hypothetical protein